MSRKNLFTMSQDKFTAFKQLLHDAGLTPELITRVLKGATPRQMREWVRDCPPRRRARFAYDAAKILCFREGRTFDSEFPEAEPGEMVIHYGGWSYKDLYNNALVVRERLLENNFGSTTPPWYEERLPPGWYRLRLEIPGNAASDFEDRTQDLLPAEKVAPPCLVATGLLTHYLVTGKWLVRYKVGSAVSNDTVSFILEHNTNWLKVENHTNCADMTGYRLITTS